MKKLFLPAFICLIALTATAQPYAFDTLDINNVRAVFNSVGINFSNDYNSFLEVPKGSNNKTIGCNTLWVSGQDNSGQITLSGGIVSSNGKDYYPGPLSADGAAYTDSTIMAQWNKVWKVTRQQIQYHITHYGLISYVAPDGIANWPAHGDSSLHQATNLAPFVDVNGDGKYNPAAGDYPFIRGDEAIYFIFNDKGGSHGATGGIPKGIEVHAMAYAFDCSSDSALNNTIFLHYKVINRSTYVSTHVMMGIYSDIGISGGLYDFTRSDIMRNSFYSYPATNVNPVLGNYFPAQATTILGGPLMDPDGLDNPAFDTLFSAVNCNEAVNGLNFGDCIVDNERYGMTGFISFNNGGNPLVSEPESCADYLRYLNTTWRDGTKLQYGGYGYEHLSPYGPDCKFMYPALSDPCDWGTFGNPPNGPRNWTEETAFNPPGDREGLAIMGPLTLDASDFREIDLAFIYAMDYSQPGELHAWQPVMNQRIDSIRSYFKKDALPCGGSISGLSQATNSKQEAKMLVFPNPASNILYVSIPDKVNAVYTCQIFDLQGKLCQEAKIGINPSVEINVSGLPAGMYQLILRNESNNFSAKFIKQ